MPYIERHLPLHETLLIDLVGDMYISDSLTSSTRHIMGKGILSRAIGKTIAPSNWNSWKESLHVDEQGRTV